MSSILAQVRDLNRATETGARKHEAEPRHDVSILSFIRHNTNWTAGALKAPAFFCRKQAPPAESIGNTTSPRPSSARRLEYAGQNPMPARCS